MAKKKIRVEFDLIEGTPETQAMLADAARLQTTIHQICKAAAIRAYSTGGIPVPPAQQIARVEPPPPSSATAETRGMLDRAANFDDDNF